MSLIEWDDNTLSVGVDILDNQHKILVGLINKLSKYIENEKPTTAINKLFEELVEYTQYHFNTEETYFERLNNKDLHLHKLQHKHLLEQLNSFMKQSPPRVTPEILDFLLDWFVIHVQCEDKKFIQG